MKYRNGCSDTKTEPYSHLISTSNFHQNLNLVILIIDQTLEPLLLNLRQFDLLRNHFMRPHPSATQRINHLLEIANLVRRDAQICPLLEIEVVCMNRARLLPNGNVDNTPARSCCMHSLIERGLHARAIVDDVDALVVGEFAAALDEVLLDRVDNIVCAELLCKLLSTSAHFRDDDLVAALGFERQDRRYTDRTAPEDERDVSLLERADLDGVPADREGLDEGTDLEWDVVGEMVQGGDGHDDVVCKAAAPATESDEAVLPAAVVEAFFAGAACAVVDDGLDYDSVAGLVVCHAFADFFDYTAEFMAEC